MLFQLYINGINNVITSQIKLFVGDSILYINIFNQNDQRFLQNCLNTISLWAKKWLIELNINKCSVLSITIKRHSIFHDHNILGTTLKRVTNHDYLGVTTSSDPSWLNHAKKFQTRLEEPLANLKEPHLPADKT